MDVYLRLLIEKADEALLHEEAAQLLADADRTRPDTFWRLVADRLKRRAETRKTGY